MNQPVNRPRQFGRYGFLLLSALLGAGGCVQPGGWNPPEISRSTASMSADSQLYRCDEGVTFTAVVNEDSAMLDGDWGKASLLRDAGGEGRARIYSNRNLRAEFSLGPDGRTAALHELTGLDMAREPRHLGCRRE